MMRFVLFAIYGLIALVGCSKQSAAPTSEVAHEHVSGPHGGQIHELGEYHAELVDDDVTGTVTIHILDGAAAKNVPVDAAEAVINVTHDGQGSQFKLAAVPLEGEPEGFASSFVSSEGELGEMLDDENAKAAFVVTINGMPHRTDIEHHHDDEHDHDHDEHSH